MEKIRIRVGKNSDPGSGINIPDPQYCYFLFLSGTLSRGAWGLVGLRYYYQLACPQMKVKVNAKIRRLVMVF
jgi:hypothetical protein